MSTSLQNQGSHASVLLSGSPPSELGTDQAVIAFSGSHARDGFGEAGVTRRRPCDRGQASRLGGANWQLGVVCARSSFGEATASERSLRRLRTDWRTSTRIPAYLRQSRRPLRAVRSDEGSNP